MLKFCKIVDNINKWFGHAICYLLIFITLTGVYEVSMRYFFGLPTIWVWELNAHIQAMFIALGGGYVLLGNAHVKIDLIYASLSIRVKAIVDVFSSFFTFLYLGVFLLQTSKMVLGSIRNLEHSSTLFSLPVYPFKFVLVIGSFLFLLQAVTGFIRNLYIACLGKNLDKNEI